MTVDLENKGQPAIPDPRGAGPSLPQEGEPEGETEVYRHRDSDRKLNLTVASILAAGLALAAGLLVAGAVLALTGHGPNTEAGLPIGDIPRAIRALEPSGFFYLGLVILLATPVSRVMVLAAVFAWRKSWTFCALGLFVLVVLVLSVLLGLET